MDSFEGQHEWMYPAMVPSDFQQLDQSQPASLCQSESLLDQVVPSFGFPPLQHALPVFSASCSGATHLELSDSLAERAVEHTDQALVASAMSFDTVFDTSTPPLSCNLNLHEVDACSKLFPTYFATNKERIKHELEMALRRPSQITQPQPELWPEHSSVSAQANSIPTATAPIKSSRVRKNKRSKPNKTKRSRAPARPWTEQEHQRFKESLELYGRDWEKCAKYIGTRRAQLVRSHAQKHLIKLWKLGLPLPKKVAESGRGYTLSGKPLLAESASAKSYLTKISGPSIPLNQIN